MVSKIRCVIMVKRSAAVDLNSLSLSRAHDNLLAALLS